MSQSVTNPIGYGLHYQLISFWNLEEASGNRVDSSPLTFYKTATNTLTPTNTPGNQAGKIGNAVALGGLASMQSLSAGNPVSLRLGTGVRLTICVWVNLTAKATAQVILAQNGGAGAFSHYLRYDLANDTFLFSVSANGSSGTSVLSTNFGSPSASTWYFIVARYDGTNISISVNNGAFNNTAFSSDIFNNVFANFSVGRQGAMVALFFGGAIDAIGFWKRALNAQEITYLYNGGNGRQWPLV